MRLAPRIARRAVAAALLAPTLALAAPTRPVAPPIASPKAPVAPALAPRIDALRDEARALVLVQSVLSWYTRTVGEPSMQADTYVGHEQLLSLDSMRVVAAAASAERDPERKRALGFLKMYLAGEFMGRQLAHFDDEEQNAELAATVALPWEKAPVPYKQLDILSGTEKDAARRAAIESAKARVWKETLNPLLERKEAEAQRLAKVLGYPSYVALAEEVRLVDLRALIAESDRFRAATDALYRELLAEVAKKELGVTPAGLHRSDIARMRKMPRFERFFPKELAVPAFEHFLGGIGLDLSTVGGARVRIDDALHPQKEPRAACYAIRVPDDIRVSVKPTGGVDDFVTFFHEGGHALHYANTRSTSWEFQQLGPYTLTEGLAETFGHAWDEPAWLRRYRDFVTAWNRDHKTSYPTMSDADIAELARMRVFEELYFLRRYGAAKLIYEAALHGGDPSLWRAAWTGPTADLKALYRALFARAYGFPLTEEDALRYRTDVDDLFYAADYTRAFAMANTVHEGLRAKFGADWFGNKAVGAFLRGELFRDGNRLQPDEVARLFGQPRLDLRPTEARFHRLLGK